MTEIYDVIKENQPYDEKRYTNALKEMLKQCIDFEDTYSIPDEWDNWDELVQRGYEAQEKGNEKRMISNWWEAWLEDMEMELGNAGEHEKRMEFCREVLEMFDWKYDDCDNFRSAIGEEFYATGKIEEGKEWFEVWLEKKPHNENALCAYSWCIQENEGAVVVKNIRNVVEENEERNTYLWSVRYRRKFCYW